MLNRETLYALVRAAKPDASFTDIMDLLMDSGQDVDGMALIQVDKAISPTICNDVTEIPKAECEALVTFYDSTNGDNWTNQIRIDDWKVTNMPCSWCGVMEEFMEFP